MTSNIFKAGAIVALAVCAGCVAADFEPQTMQGVQCKSDCAHGMQLCSGSSYTCDRSYAMCIDACIDVEAMALKGK